MFPWSKKSRRKTNYTHTPARQRAVNRKSYIVAALSVAAVIVALAQFGEDGLATFFKLRSYENELVQDVQRQDDQNTWMQTKLYDLANDPAKLEALAREEHNMQLPHEEVLTVFPETKNNQEKD